MRVEIGDAEHRSRILMPGEKPRDGAVVIEVPEEYLEPMGDLGETLREMAGVPIRDCMDYRRLPRRRPCPKPR